MSDAAASDDTDLAAAAHLGTVTSTTAIAMGERQRACGRDVLAAIVVGYEIGHRIGERVRPGRGWLPSGGDHDLLRHCRRRQVA